MSVDTSRLKEIPLTMRDLVRFESQLATLSNTQGLPTKTAFRLSRLIAKLTPEYEEYHKRRAEVIRQYGEQLDPNVDSWNVPKDKEKAFAAEIDELMNETVVLPNWRPLTIEDFGKAEVLPATLVALNIFLEDDEDAE